MNIDFTFDKTLGACDYLDVRTGSSVKRVYLADINTFTKRFEEPGVTGQVCFTKHNDWLNGMSEVIFSFDIIFENALSGQRLPYSFEVYANPSDLVNVIDVPTDVVIHTNEQSQIRWKYVVWIQFLITSLLLAIPFLVYAIVFRSLVAWIVMSWILCIVALFIGVKRRISSVLRMINRHIPSCDNPCDKNQN